jgi:hypothetical protein
VLEAPWHDSFEPLIIDNKIKYIRLSDFAGWKEDRLDFLTSIPSLHGVEIYSSKIKDLTPITKLLNLKQLALECPYKSIDFSAFAKLEHLFLRWRPKSDSIFDLTNMLTLNMVNFPEANLNKLSKMLKLTSIKLTSQKLYSLHGIENLQELTSIDLFRCPKIETLKNIDLCKRLTSLDIESCKNILDFELIKNNKLLRRIALNNCGEIDSLKFLENLNNLEEIIFVDNTNIIDGDLSFLNSLLKLKNTRFADRIHYSVKRDFVNSQITNCFHL